MQPSINGILVCAALLIFSYGMRWSIVSTLLMSLAFGSTAIGTLTGLGGSSPLIFTIFAAITILVALMRRHLWREIGAVFGRLSMAWIVCAMMAYGAVSALVFPRFFAGQTTVFATSRTGRGVYETALAPVSANISQTGYFLLSGLTFLALCVLLRNPRALLDVKRGLFAWFWLHTGMGLIDLGSKLSGAGDVLEPIRTASYAMLTQAIEAGFWRIAGAYAEASAFGSVSLVGLAFSYVYWRRTGSREAVVLGTILLVLILLSTSSTAYLGLTVLSIPVAASLITSILKGRLSKADLFICGAFLVVTVRVLAIVITEPRFFDPFVHLFKSTMLNKMDTESGRERSYWNYKGIEAFIDTAGFGVGLGSSRASSWLIAVISQLGLVGSILMAVMVASLARGFNRTPRSVDPEELAIVAASRACGLAALLVASIAGGNADPGLSVFIPLAVVVTARGRWRAEMKPAVVHRPLMAAAAAHL
jgi:hypothetical protein